MAQPTPDDNLLDWRDFLTNKAPGTRAIVQQGAVKASHLAAVDVATPELPLFCNGNCQGTTHCTGTIQAAGKLFGGVEKNLFQSSSPSLPLAQNMPYDIVLCYSCEKCETVVKSYSVRFWSVPFSSETTSPADALKIAEWPPFLPRTPAKLMSLVGPDRELFLKGRRAELEGLGVGAFAYYRRIIENQKNRLLEEIIRVARHFGTPTEVIAKLEAAKAETQFSKAVATVKEAIPAVLFIKEHNPLTLLHAALSEGLHDASDEECLLAANDIRLILVEFAERLSEAMKEQKELDEALTRLINRNK